MSDRFRVKQGEKEPPHRRAGLQAGRGRPPVRPARVHRAQPEEAVRRRAPREREGGAALWAKRTRCILKSREGGAAPFRGSGSSGRVAQLGGRAQRGYLRTSVWEPTSCATRTELIEPRYGAAPTYELDRGQVRWRARVCRGANGVACEPGVHGAARRRSVGENLGAGARVRLETAGRRLASCVGIAGV